MIHFSVNWIRETIKFRGYIKQKIPRKVTETIVLYMLAMSFFELNTGINSRWAIRARTQPSLLFSPCTSHVDLATSCTVLSQDWVWSEKVGIIMGRFFISFISSKLSLQVNTGSCNFSSQSISSFGVLASKFIYGVEWHLTDKSPWSLPFLILKILWTANTRSSSLSLQTNEAKTFSEWAW